MTKNHHFLDLCCNFRYLIFDRKHIKSWENGQIGLIFGIINVPFAHIGPYKMSKTPNIQKLMMPRVIAHNFEPLNIY